ncbi:MAG: AAA family ATPase [Anaerolineaceae bacterium]|nr:AAA family ATPase [Anaerolineaceae bacterium]
MTKNDFPMQNDLNQNSADSGFSEGDSFSVRSLRELIDLVSGKSIKEDQLSPDSILTENLPFPFFGIVGQMEMKIALLLSIINPMIGGIILIGPRGTGKTTAVRSLLNLLPLVYRSLCHYGCTENDIEAGGMNSVCPDCAKKYAEGSPLSKSDISRLVELPLNATLENVIGGIDEVNNKTGFNRIKKGILAHADQNLLYVDEINILPDVIIDAILDAAAHGIYTLRRGPIAASYKARFTLIGSMNPEEGTLRPQIMDRFGLRVIVRGLEDNLQRFEAYKRVSLFKQNPHQIINQFNPETLHAKKEIQQARELLKQVIIPESIANAGVKLIKELGIASLRAEITLFEAARTYAAADARTEVTLEDLKFVAPFSLRLRSSEFIKEYFDQRKKEEQLLNQKLDNIN